MTSQIKVGAMSSRMLSHRGTKRSPKLWDDLQFSQLQEDNSGACFTRTLTHALIMKNSTLKQSYTESMQHIVVCIKEYACFCRMYCSVGSSTCVPWKPNQQALMWHLNNRKLSINAINTGCFISIFVLTEIYPD